MRSLFLLVLAGWMAMLAQGSAQAPAGYRKIYDAPTTVNLARRPVIADIEFHADRVAAQRGELKLALVTDVTEFVTQTEDDLKNWIANRREDCGERWRSGDPRIRFPDNAIRFTIYLEIEYWTCGLTGRTEPARMAQETGAVDVVLFPYVENGRLQARLGRFDLTDQTGLSKYLPLEFVIRRAADSEIAKLNDNPKFYRAPQPLYEEGFVYEGISAAETRDGRVIITALYRAKGDEAALDRIVRKLRSNGITQ